MSILLGLDDTIVAVASPAGAGWRGIVRVSGPRTVDVIERCVRPLESGLALRSVTRATAIPAALRAVGVSVPIQGRLFLWPTQRSYTGEPTAEWHMLSVPPLLNAVQEAICSQGARPARAGEFTLRAFLHGRIDLAQAEAVLGTIEASDERELRRALDQHNGGLSQLIATLQRDLLDLLADLEAGLDFAHEGIDFVPHEALLRRLEASRERIRDLCQSARQRARSTAHRNVVFAGRPNAGKSTLYNALVGRSVALTSPIPGTTRDYLSAEVEWDGVPLRLIDTAGEEASDQDETGQAQRARQEQLAQASLVLLCLAPEEVAARRHSAESDSTMCPPSSGIAIDKPTSAELERDTVVQIVVHTKCDLPAREPIEFDTATTSAAAQAMNEAFSGPVCLSVHKGEGLAELRARIVAALRTDRAADAGWLASTSARAADSLTRAEDSLTRALAVASPQAGDCDHVLLAVELRSALDDLGLIVGNVYTDDLLDRIFSKFCIGK